MNIRLVCGNCGKIEYFESFQAAENKGWDSIITFGYNACEGCLGTSVYFPMLYARYAKQAATPQERDEWLQKAAEETMRFDPHGVA